MPAYAYRAVDPTGARVRGRANGASHDAVTRDLAGRGLTVLSVDVAAPSGASGVLAFGRVGRARRRDVLEVTRALAALLPAGMPLARALGASANLASGALAEALTQVRGRVERGDPLAAALAAHPAVFPPIYVGLVRAGERSGDLAGAFQRLAGQLEREMQLREKLLSASIYPLLLAGVGGVAVLVLLFLVLPRFAELLDGAGAALPASTAALLALAAGARRWWPAGLAAGVLALVVFAWIRRGDAGRRAGARLLLALPVAGAVRRAALGARFARLTGVLLGGGAPLLAALDGTLESLADPVAHADVERVRARVREGVPLHRALADGPLFPPLLAQLVAVGEESGRLTEFLLKAADLLEERTERAASRLVTLAEPAMIVLFGGVVGFVALSLLQAVYSVNAGSFR